MFIMNAVTDWANNSFHHFLLWIDSAVYWLAAKAYKLFIILSSARIFEDDFYQNFANRIYAIIGVFMLFYFAYSLLSALVDPDKLTKGDKSFSKIAGNFIVSLVMIGLLPSIFTYAYRMQNYILSTNVIGTIIFGTPMKNVNSTGTSTTTNDTIANYGNSMAFIVLNAFLNPENINQAGGKDASQQVENWFDVKQDIIKNGDFSGIAGFSENVSKGKATLDSNGQEIGGKNNLVVMTYYPVISTIAGAYLCYIMVSFCLDLGLRIVKLAFCQLIAPIPILMRALPGQKGTFDKWLKLTLSVYFEVFVRVATVYIGVYFISQLASGGASSIISTYMKAGGMWLLALVFILLGILTFVKQAPKMISDMLGIDTGNMKLGIKDKLKAGGFFAGGAMLGAGAVGLARNLNHGIGYSANSFKNSIGQFKDGHVLKGLMGAGKGVIGLGQGALSGVAGGISAMGHAASAGVAAKGFGDMAKASKTGYTASTNARIARDSYASSHPGVLGSQRGHVADAAGSAASLLGISANLEELQARQTRVQSVADARKALNDRASAIRDNVEHGNRVVKNFEFTGVDGKKHIFDQEINLGVLQKGYESMVTSGTASAEDMKQVELELEGAKEQANKDIIAGLGLDGVTKKAAKDYDSQLVTGAVQLMTNYKAAAGDLKQNVTDNIDSLAKAQDFVSHHSNDDVAAGVAAGTFDLNALMSAVKKPTGEANGKLNEAINRVYQEKKK